MILDAVEATLSIDTANLTWLLGMSLKGLSVWLTGDIQVEEKPATDLVIDSFVKATPLGLTIDLFPP